MDRLKGLKDGTPAENGPLPGAASSNGTSEKTERPEKPVTSAFQDLLRGIGELKEYASFFLAAKADAVRFKLIKAAFLAGLGLAGLIALITLIVTSTLLLVSGLSEGVGKAVGGLWLGNVIIGAVFLLGLGLGGFLALGMWKRRALERMVRKYDRRKQEQRERWGRDVEERSKASPSTHE